MMNKLNVKVMFLVIILSGINQKLEAASPGSLDPSFGIAGKIATDIFGDDRLKDIAVQPDGKIIAVGTSGVNDFTIVRYTVNGVLDTTFSGDGIAFVDMGGSNDTAQDVEVQVDGKIIVAGTFGGSETGLGMVRFNANGTLDTTFDNDGKLTISDFNSRGLELQSDGKIVIAGNSNLDVSVIRLNANGSFDTTFDTDGRVTTNVQGTDTANEVKIQNDGKIVIAGNAFFTELSILVRYNTNGSLDTSFSGDGIVSMDHVGAGEESRSLAIDSISGAITTFGENLLGGMLAVRYTSNGNLDNSFNGNGKLIISSPIVSGVEILQQSDRKFICAGMGSGLTIELVRINTNGTIDTSFGKNGFVSLNFNGGFNTRNMVLVGDKLLVGNDANSQTDFGIERFNLSITPSQSGDFDGDGFGDIAVYRPSQGLWIILNSSNNSVVFKQFGLNGDIPIDGDFDGDGRNDLAIYRPSEGLWFVEKSSDGTNFARQFGTSTDKPATDDYDKDGKADIAFFRPSSGEWFILRSSDGFNTFFSFPFGANGDIPIVKKGP